MLEGLPPTMWSCEECMHADICVGATAARSEEGGARLRDRHGSCTAGAQGACTGGGCHRADRGEGVLPTSPPYTCQSTAAENY